MKDIDLQQWACEIKAPAPEEIHSNPISPEHANDESPNKKSPKIDDVQNLNMPKKNSHVRTSKYQQLEKIEEI
jgi:hypothetical protein